MRLTDTEWKVMQAVWSGGPCRARDVHDHLGDETHWAYTTVKTLLDRLEEKGAVTIRKSGNANLYEARITREEARRSAVRDLLDRAFEGAVSPLLHFLADERSLSARERRELRALLEREESRDRRRRR